MFSYPYFKKEKKKENEMQQESIKCFHAQAPVYFKEKMSYVVPVMQ